MQALPDFALSNMYFQGGGGGGVTGFLWTSNTFWEEACVGAPAFF